MDKDASRLGSGFKFKIGWGISDPRTGLVVSLKIDKDRRDDEFSFTRYNREDEVVKKAEGVLSSNYYLEDINRDQFKASFDIGSHYKYGITGYKDLDITYEYTIASREDYHREDDSRRVSVEYKVIE
ncbi:hypothetical protein [Dethiothermospora halolimnae]|uniref:hypothetical protein n=1 Tax=Dethiothermospora halolimnae TaxID=3114390 RepID=UPI003CCBF153